MCNFVPGECVAFGSLDNLDDLVGKDLPGFVKIIRLRMNEDATEGVESPFDRYGFAHVTGIPHGREIAVVSELSALLADSVRKKTATVELNYALPAALPTFTNGRNPELSEFALAWARAIRAGNGVPGPVPPPVAFIDSGADTSAIRRRNVLVLDCSDGTARADPNGGNDRKGHGTRVAKLLNECLPPEVPLVNAKIGDFDSDVTVLNLARTFAEVVARYRPAVVNVSLAPLDDTFVCPGCSEAVRTPAFHSTILRRVFGLARRSLVVMAAGNQGQECNEPHADELVENLVFAVAVGSSCHRTRYSAAPTGPNASELTAFAFGGDDVSDAAGVGVFADDRKQVGTSFAAPFISASIYAEAARRVQAGLDLRRRDVMRPHHSLSAQGWYPDELRHRLRHDLPLAT